MSGKSIRKHKEYFSNNLLSEADVAQIISESPETGERFCFILGSGASKASGAPSNETLVEEWMKWIMGESKEDDPLRRPLAETQDIADRKNIPFAAIKKEWTDRLGKVDARFASKYFLDIYCLRFYPNLRYGLLEMEQRTEGASPSIGFSPLARIMTELPRNNVAATVSFDTLLEDGIFEQTGTRPLVLNSATTANVFADPNIPLPLVVKVQSDLFSSFSEGVQNAEEKRNWNNVLSAIFENYTPIVVGFEEEDGRLLSLLEDARMKRQILWCCQEEEGLPDERIVSLVRRAAGSFVNTKGFDAFFAALGLALFDEEYLIPEEELFEEEPFVEEAAALEDIPAQTADFEDFGGIEDASAKPWWEAGEIPADVIKPEPESALDAEDPIQAERENRPSNIINLDDPRGSFEHFRTEYTARLAKISGYSEAEPTTEDAAASAEPIETETGARFDTGFETDTAEAEKRSSRESEAPLPLEERSFVPETIEKKGLQGAKHLKQDFSFDSLEDELEPDPIADDSPWELYGQAKRLMDEGRYYEALACGSNALSQAPENVTFLNLQAEIRRKIQPGVYPAEIDTAIENNPSHPQSYDNRGAQCHVMGSYPQALESYEYALKLRQERLGELHPEIAATYCKIGEEHQAMGHYQKAFKRYRKALDINRASAGIDDPSNADYYSKIGALFRAVGDYPKALEFENTALGLRIETHGTVHPSVADSYGELGLCYRAMGDRENALEYARKALKLKKSLLGEHHPDTIDANLNLGDLFSDLGDSDRAMHYYREALYAAKEAYGDDHPEAARCYGRIGLLCLSLKDREHAQAFCEQALRIQGECLGANHPASADSLIAIGDIYLESKNQKQAGACYQLALEIYEDCFEQCHPSIADCHSKLGQLCRIRGDYDDAMDHFETALEIRKETLGKNHPDVAISCRDIADLYRKQGKNKKALKTYQETLNTTHKSLGNGKKDDILPKKEPKKKKKKKNAK